MKKKILTILLILFVCFAPTLGQQLSLPKDCVKVLNKKYKGWKMATVANDVVDWFQKSKQLFKPNLIKGDWNGDKKTDYAVLIEVGKVQLNGGSYEPKVLLIAFVNTSKSYTFHLLNDGNYEYIAFLKKGGRDYNWETEKNFFYKNDAIFTGYFEKAGSSYIWRKGKFISIVTSD